MFKQLVALSVAAGLSLMTSAAIAQCGCGPAQASYTTYYTPTYCPPASNVTYYQSATPQAAYYTPGSQPYMAYYAPAAQPYTAYYTPAAQPYAVYCGTQGRSIYGTPKVYVPGESVRNVLRAITP